MTMFDGQVMTGGMVSMMVMVWLHEAVLVQESVACQVRVASKVLEPISLRAAVEPDLAIAVLVPHRGHLHAAVATRSSDDRRDRLVEERLQPWAELKCHTDCIH